MATILITGGSGLIGKALSQKLLAEGHQVRILSRTPNPQSKIPAFFWDVEKQEIDEKAFDGIDHLVHLAGEGVADKRWTEKRKKEVIDSRVNSMKLITRVIKKKNILLKSVVGASATGIYGMVTSDKIFTETDKGPEDFLTHTCEVWERSYDEISGLSEKTVVIRISVVLSKQGGALKLLLPLFNMGLGSAVGKGSQYMPWIHIDDLISVIHHGLFDPDFKGVYNAVAPEHHTSNSFSAALAKALHKPFFAPNVPAFALRLLFGEMANVLLLGSRVSSKKLTDAGFVFQYPNLKQAFEKIVSEKPE